jgi:hypothetical protein
VPAACLQCLAQHALWRGHLECLGTEGACLTLCTLSGAVVAQNQASIDYAGNWLQVCAGLG